MKSWTQSPKQQYLKSQPNHSYFWCWVNRQFSLSSGQSLPALVSRWGNGSCVAYCFIEAVSCGWTWCRDELYFEDTSNFQILLWGSGERALICPAEQAQNSEHMHLMACGGLFTFVLPAPPPPLQPRSPMWLMIQTINDPCLCLFFPQSYSYFGDPSVS